jgi:DNA topoisomerase-1
MPASRRHGLKTDEAALAIFLEKDAKRRAREAARKNRKGTVPNDARLTNLLAESSKKARAGGLKASGKSAAAQAVSTVARETRPKAARPAAKKLARTRSPAALAMS